MAKLTTKVVRWFPIPNDPDNARLQIVHLKPGEIQRIEADTTEWTGKSDAGTEEFAVGMKFNPTDQARRLRLSAVVGWEGFFGVKDEQLDFSRKNLNLFLDEDPMLGGEDNEMKLSEWIDKFRKVLIDEMKPKTEEALPN